VSGGISQVETVRQNVSFTHYSRSAATNFKASQLWHDTVGVVHQSGQPNREALPSADRLPGIGALLLRGGVTCPLRCTRFHSHLQILKRQHLPCGGPRSLEPLVHRSHLCASALTATPQPGANLAHTCGGRSSQPTCLRIVALQEHGVTNHG